MSQALTLTQDRATVTVSTPTLNPTAKARPALRLVKTQTLSRDEWLDVRKRGIGGSDAGAAVGLNPYQSRLALWLNKTGRDAGMPSIDPHDDSHPAYWGNLLEPIVAAHYSRRTGHKVRRVNAVLQQYQYPYACRRIECDQQSGDDEHPRHRLQ